METECELLAISAGSVLRRDMNAEVFPEVDLWHDLDKDSGVYEFYNVLWIEWTEHIAYRKGLGRVCKASWDAADTKEMDVILG